MSEGFQVSKGNMGFPVEPVGSEVAPVVDSQDFESFEGFVAEDFGVVLEVSFEDFGVAPEVNSGCQILIYDWILMLLVFRDV